jgi:hypothetical protein
MRWQDRAGAPHRPGPREIAMPCWVAGAACWIAALPFGESSGMFILLLIAALVLITTGLTLSVIALMRED